MINNLGQKLSIIGYASGIGGKHLGCNEGPETLRKRGLKQALENLGYQVIDRRDAKADSKDHALFKRETTPDENSINNIDDVFSSCKQLAHLCKEALEDNSFPLILGGDHSLSIGSIAAFSNFFKEQKQEIGLIWVDTHPDVNTPATSPSNNPFGMSVAFLLGLIPGALNKLQKEVPAIKKENLVYIGLRDVDPGEKELIKNSSIAAFSMKEIDLLGIANVTKQAIELASKNTAGFILSFDLDVCDPQLVPGTGTPFRGGLSFREAHLLMELMYESKKMLGLELVELNPKLDKNYETADFALNLIESALGKSIL